MDAEGQDRPRLDARLPAATQHGGDGCRAETAEGERERFRGGFCVCLFNYFMDTVVLVILLLLLLLLILLVCCCGTTATDGLICH